MAYKYQLGDAVMSGSLTQEGGITAEGNIDASTGFVDTTTGTNGGYRFGGGEFKLFRNASRKLTLQCSASNDAPRSMQVQYEFSSSSPANGDILYHALYRGYDSAGNIMQASYRCQVADVTSDSERAGFHWSPIVGGTSTAMFDINYTTANTVTIMDGAFDFDVASHDGTNGLKLAGTLVTSTAAEVNLLDGGTSVGGSITIADGDGVIVNDGGTSKLVPASDFKTFVGSLSVVSKADGGTLEADKVNYFGDLGSSATVTLPASDNSLIGKSIYVKAKDLTSGAKIIINTQASDQKVDSSNSIELESPFASVRLVYVAADDWRIF